MPSTSADDLGSISSKACRHARPNPPPDRTLKRGLRPETQERNCLVRTLNTCTPGGKCCGHTGAVAFEDQSPPRLDVEPLSASRSMSGVSRARTKSPPGPDTSGRRLASWRKTKGAAIDRDWTGPATITCVSGRGVGPVGQRVAAGAVKNVYH
jgi:hypothetical protein